MNKEELAELEQIRESILKTNERAKTVKQLETAIWDIWKHAKLNRDSLISERQIKQITALVHNAVQGVQLRLEELAAAHHVTKRKLAEERAEIKRFKKAIDLKKASIAILERRVKKLTADAKKPGFVRSSGTTVADSRIGDGELSAVSPEQGADIEPAHK